MDKLLNSKDGSFNSQGLPRLASNGDAGVSDAIKQAESQKETKPDEKNGVIDTIQKGLKANDNFQAAYKVVGKEGRENLKNTLDAVSDIRHTIEGHEKVMDINGRTESISKEDFKRFEQNDLVKKTDQGWRLDKSFDDLKAGYSSSLGSSQVGLEPRNQPITAGYNR